MKALAIKYRPKTFDDVVEQDNIKIILQQQLKTGTFKNAYLFTGGAGTGKTTCARIFANEINRGQGNPIELDAASNNGVDNVRDIIQQAQLQSLDSEFKVFIIDECHMITTAGWNAMLKLIEEPPAKSIFIFCTTNPEKIPKTILSRVQRYDFKRISQKGIVDRLSYITSVENGIKPEDIGQETPDVYEYIAKLSDGGMRDAITLLDKTLSYSTKLTLDNVVKALGTVNYDVMIKLTEAIYYYDAEKSIKILDDIHNEGKDLKQFVKDYLVFLIDVVKYGRGCDFKYLTIPRIYAYEKFLDELSMEEYKTLDRLLCDWVKLNADIKYSSIPKADIEVVLVKYGDMRR